MIAFYSPEGSALRALQPSPSAIAAIWYQAVHDGRGDWVDWVRDELASQLGDADLAAIRFVEAAINGEVKRAQQLWTVLGSFPVSGRESHFVRAAREMRASLPV
jgi:hypothetical protein